MKLMRTLMLFTALLATTQLVLVDAVRALDPASTAEHQLTLNADSVTSVLFLIQEDLPEHDIAFTPDSLALPVEPSVWHQTRERGPALAARHHGFFIRGPPTA